MPGVKHALKKIPAACIGRLLLYCVGFEQRVVTACYEVLRRDSGRSIAHSTPPFVSFAHTLLIVPPAYSPSLVILRCENKTLIFRYENTTGMAPRDAFLPFQCLGNLCTLQLHNAASAACSLFSTVLENRLGNNHAQVRALVLSTEYSRIVWS